MKNKEIKTFESMGFKSIRKDSAFHIYEKDNVKFVFNLKKHSYFKDSNDDQTINIYESAAIIHELTELRWIP